MMTTIEEVKEHLKELEPLKMEFTDKEDNYHKISTYIKRVFNDHILINPPETGGILHELNENSLLNLIFPRKDGVLIAQCSFLGRQLGTLSGIKVSHPHDINILERREYVRVPLKVRTNITFNNPSQEKISINVVTKNISGSGIAFFYENSLDNCYDIVCKLFLNDGNPVPVKVTCRQVYSKKAKVKNSVNFLTALTYTKVSEEDSARIIKECFKYQINRRHVD